MPGAYDLRLSWLILRPLVPDQKHYPSIALVLNLQLKYLVCLDWIPVGILHNHSANLSRLFFVRFRVGRSTGQVWLIEGPDKGLRYCVRTLLRVEVDAAFHKGHFLVLMVDETGSAGVMEQLLWINDTRVPSFKPIKIDISRPSQPCDETNSTL